MAKLVADVVVVGISNRHEAPNAGGVQDGPTEGVAIEIAEHRHDLRSLARAEPARRGHDGLDDRRSQQLKRTESATDDRIRPAPQREDLAVDRRPLGAAVDDGAERIVVESCLHPLPDE